VNITGSNIGVYPRRLANHPAGSLVASRRDRSSRFTTAVTISTAVIGSDARATRRRRRWGCVRIPSRWSLDISWPGIDRHNWSASTVPIRRTTVLFHSVRYSYDELRRTTSCRRTRPCRLCKLDSSLSRNEKEAGPIKLDS